MSVSKKSFSDAASLYTIENKNGMQVVVSDFGGVLQALRVPDKNGDLVDVVCGYDTVEEYQNNPQYQGQLVGRFANRIGGAEFTLQGETYKLDANEGKNVLHGGFKPYGIRMWDARTEENAVEFTLLSPDGDQGMPGNATISVIYRLSEENALHIKYHAVADKDTYFNLINHAYFNLAGHDSGTIMDQYMQLACSKITAIDAEFIPTGELMDVTGTAMDFLEEKQIGRDIDMRECEQIQMGNGYDHNYVIDEPGYDKPFVRCFSEKSGIVMEGYTDLPGVQVYSGNNMGAVKGGKGGAYYPCHGGFCLETQYFPDTPNKSNFPSCFYQAGQAFESETIYKFSKL